MDEQEILAEIERLAALLDNQVHRCARCRKPLVGKRIDATTCSAACRVALCRERRTILPPRPVTVSNATKPSVPGQPRKSIPSPCAAQWPQAEVIMPRIRPAWVQSARQSADEAPDWPGSAD